MHSSLIKSLTVADVESFVPVSYDSETSETNDQAYSCPREWRPSGVLLKSLEHHGIISFIITYSNEGFKGAVNRAYEGRQSLGELMQVFQSETVTTQTII